MSLCQSEQIIIPTCILQKPVNLMCVRKSLAVTYNQFTALIVQRLLLFKLETTSADDPEGDWMVETDQALDHGVPDVLREPAYGLQVFVVFLVTSRARTLRYGL